MIQDHLFLAWVKKFVCFPAGTPVVVGREGDRLLTRPIETLRAGDKVLARDEYGSAVGLCPIVAVSVRRAATLLHVQFRGDDGHAHTISCTPGHPFWVAERAGYVSADELLPGDTLSGPDGERLTFLSSERQDLPELIPVYNFEVAEAHTYFVTAVGDPATAVLVHNGLLRCSNGRLKDSETGRFVADPANPPSTNTMTDAQRRARWKQLADDPNSGLTQAQRDQIKARGGRGPHQLNRFGEVETMELSHEPIPLRDGGTNTVPRWPEDHAAVDPHRRLKKR